MAHEHKQFNLPGLSTDPNQTSPEKDFESYLNVLRTDKNFNIKDFFIFNDVEAALKQGQKVKLKSITAAYTALLNDFALGAKTSGGAFAVNLPKSSMAGMGKTYIIKDAQGSASVNNITITPNGTETIDGATTLLISTNFDAKYLITDGANWFTLNGIAAAQAASGTNLFDTTLFTFSNRLTKAQFEAATLVGTGAVNDTLGYGTEFKTGVNANSSAEGVFGDVSGENAGFLGYAKNMAFRFKFETEAAQANGKTYIYLMANSQTIAGATKYAGLRIANATVNFVCKDGVTEKLTDISATFGTLLSSHIVDIIFASGTSVKCYVDGVLLATHTVNFPPASDTTSFLSLLCRAENNASAANQSFVINDYIYQRSF